MPTPRRREERRAPAEGAAALARVAPLATRWIERLLARHEPPLTLTRFLALQAIARGGATIGALAQGAGVSSPAMSQQIAGLADAGLIELRAGSDDRRRQVLSLSANGVAVLRAAEKLLNRELAGLLAGMPPHEQDVLAHAPAQVEALLSGVRPPRRPPP